MNSVGPKESVILLSEKADLFNKYEAGILKVERKLDDIRKAVDRLKAYKTFLKARGKLKEAQAVQRCIEIVKGESHK